MKKERYLIKNSNNTKEKKDYKYFSIIPGTNNIIISAPHAYTHKRNGKIKKKDKETLAIVKILGELTKSHIIYINKDIDFDPNYDQKNIYKERLEKYIIENNINYLIDVHGTKTIKSFDIELGTNDLKNVNNDKDLIDDIVKILTKKIKKVRVDKKFKSSTNTICNYINDKLKIKTIQFEISKRYRSLSNNVKQFRTLINSLVDVVYYLERRNNMNDINYIEKYDSILDIKPSYGFKRELGKIEYNQVGLEIEVAVNYERNSYTFIKKMLTNIKEIVGENGYFVKDGTIIGEYSFEIVLDPLKVADINKIYSSILEVVDFSNGLIEISKEKKCGIHLNFNKFDIEDINEAHKRTTAFVLENKKYFDQNIYKQYKFIWDYEEYEKYQKEIGNKYLWINYIKSKLVEVRNIKTPISPKELTEVIEGLLQSLYFDKEIEIYNHKTYLKLSKLYDAAIDKTHSDNIIDKLHEDEFVVISLKNNKAQIVELSNELNEKIKEEIK